MTVVLLTGNGPEHRYVANVLCDRLDISAVVVETGLRRTRRQRLAQLRRRYDATQLASRAALALYRRAIRDRQARAAQLDAVFGADGRVFRRSELVTEVETVNRQPAHELVERLEPDRILVYGTGIVGDSMLARSRLTPLNLHTGISPAYRGNSCAFWPIHNGEPAMCGATVHEICAVIDGGSIFGTVRARLHPGDGIHAIFGRTVVAGARLYADTVVDLDTTGDRSGTPQDLRIGTEYRAHMRGLRAEWRARKLLRDGLLDHLELEPGT